ncbi:MAG: DUF6476 family protein [Gemmobacter sp.]
MNRTPQEQDVAPLPASLRFLKWLVIVLTLTMIGGVIAVVALLVTRIPQGVGTTLPALPAAIVLPEGAEARAVTFGAGWVGVVVAGPGAAGERFVVYAPDGTRRQVVDLTAP